MRIYTKDGKVLTFDREHLGEFAVYPGHPVTTAYLITKRFENFEAAQKQPDVKPGEYSCPAALSDCDIPGAGGCVYSALDLLRHLHNGTMTFEDGMQWADDVWRRVDDQLSKYRPRWEEGQTQADKIKPLLKAERWWEHGLQQAHDAT